MADWPTSLPVPMVGAITYTPQSNVIRTQMDAGVAKTRRRFTAVPEDVSFRIVVTSAGRQTLSEFVEVTLSDVLPFDWREFRQPNDTEELVKYRFKSRPTYSYAGPNLWYADIELELLTTFQGTYLLDIEGLST